MVSQSKQPNAKNRSNITKSSLVSHSKRKGDFNSADLPNKVQSIENLSECGTTSQALLSKSVENLVESDTTAQSLVRTSNTSFFNLLQSKCGSNLNLQRNIDHSNNDSPSSNDSEYESALEDNTSANQPQQLNEEEKPQNVENEPKEIAWSMEKKFANELLFQAFLKEENCWSVLDRPKPTKDGRKIIYRCNKAKRRGTQCSASIFTSDQTAPNDETIYLYRKNREHDHDQGINRANILSEEAKEKIIELYENRNKPKGILYIISRDEKFAQVTMNQIKGTIASYKIKKYGNTNITLNQFESFAKERMAVPESEDEAFVILFERSAEEEETDDDEEEWFRYCVSTKKLLQTAIDAKNIHADSTYKIVIQNYPLLVVGCSDLGGHFHLLALMLSTHEKTEDYKALFKAVAQSVNTIFQKTVKPKVLIADAAPAINNGFKQAFDEIETTTIMCWYHVTFNAKKYAVSNQANREKIKDDLDKLHLCYNERVFEIGCRFFVEKWMETEKNFIESFKKEFIDKNQNWYNDSARFAPKTNNCMERYNGTVKQNQTYYQKKNINEFKSLMLQMASDYSRKKPEFQTEVEIIQKTMDSGLEFSQLDKSVLPIPPDENGLTKVYIFAGTNETENTMAHVEQFLEHDYESFDQFAQKAFEIYELEFPEDPEDWKKGTCTHKKLNL